MTREVLIVAAVGAAACGNLKGTGGDSSPLVSFTVTVADPSGVLANAPHPALAMVWGKQWLVEPVCILPPDSRDDATKVAALIAAGCRDPFGFVPARVAANAPLVPGQPVTVDLVNLPSADLMVGDITARVAYASFIAYDDGDDDGTLRLAAPNRPPEDGRPMDNTPTTTMDTVYGGSFITMTEPDQRAAYREGSFSAVAAFYPRAGCGDPPPAFSVLAASGFTAQAAITATLAGTLPQETDLSQCVQAAPADASIAFSARASAPDLKELACTERITDSTVRYREPGASSPDLTGRTLACVHHPSFGAPSDVVELIITGAKTDACVGLTHYILKGCREGPDCGTPDWDHSLAPPSWWPC